MFGVTLAGLADAKNCLVHAFRHAGQFALVLRWSSCGVICFDGLRVLLVHSVGKEVQLPEMAFAGVRLSFVSRQPRGLADMHDAANLCVFIVRTL